MKSRLAHIQELICQPGLETEQWLQITYIYETLIRSHFIVTAPSQLSIKSTYLHHVIACYLPGLTVKRQNGSELKSGAKNKVNRKAKIAAHINKMNKWHVIDALVTALQKQVKNPRKTRKWVSKSSLNSNFCLCFWW